MVRGENQYYGTVYGNGGGVKMYELNNIYKADCRTAINNIADKSIDILMTDIPYNISQTKKIDRSRINSRNIKRTSQASKELNFDFGN